MSYVVSPLVPPSISTFKAEFNDKGQLEIQDNSGTVLRTFEVTFYGNKITDEDAKNHVKGIAVSLLKCDEEANKFFTSSAADNNASSANLYKEFKAAPITRTLFDKNGAQVGENRISEEGELRIFDDNYENHKNIHKAYDALHNILRPEYKMTYEQKTGAVVTSSKDDRLKEEIKELEKEKQKLGEKTREVEEARKKAEEEANRSREEQLKKEKEKRQIEEEIKKVEDAKKEVEAKAKADRIRNEQFKTEETNKNDIGVSFTAAPNKPNPAPGDNPAVPAAQPKISALPIPQQPVVKDTKPSAAPLTPTAGQTDGAAAPAKPKNTKAATGATPDVVVMVEQRQRPVAKGTSAPEPKSGAAIPAAVPVTPAPAGNPVIPGTPNPVLAATKPTPPQQPAVKGKNAAAPVTPAPGNPVIPANPNPVPAATQPKTPALPILPQQPAVNDKDAADSFKDAAEQLKIGRNALAEAAAEEQRKKQQLSGTVLQLQRKEIK